MVIMVEHKFEMALFIVGVLALGGAIVRTSPTAQPIPYLISLFLLFPYSYQFYDAKYASTDADVSEA